MFPLKIFKIAESSMEPTLRSGDFVLVNTLARPKVGDVIVARHPTEEKLLTKRVAEISSPTKIFVLGDNAAQSQDSRHFGEIDRELVVGKVLRVMKSG